MDQSLKQCRSQWRRVAMIRACAALLVMGSAAAGFAQGAPARLDPCTLLSQQEAATVFGAPLQPGRDMAGNCAYLGAGGGQKGVYLRLFGGETMPPGAVLQMYKGMLQHEHGPTEPYAGLGEQADFIKVNDEGLRLQVLYHHRIVSLGAFGSGNPDAKAALVQAMRQVLQRL